MFCLKSKTSKISALNIMFHVNLTFKFYCTIIIVI